MKEARYMVIGRYTEGVNILGYMVQDMITGNAGICDRKHVEMMALNKTIENVTAQVYNGKVIMKGLNCKLSELPKYDKNGNLIVAAQKQPAVTEEIIITDRIGDGKTITGYVVALINNGVKCSEARLSRDKVMELARDGKIANARVQMSNGKPVLRGVKCELAKLNRRS